MLTQLPKRAAFVRSGDETGVIYTDNTPVQVSAEETKKRFIQIQAQTRERYCIHKDSLNDGVPPAVKEPQSERWQEVR